MKCPACENELQEMTAGNIKVDVCKDGCGGIWFDAFELQKVDSSQESAGECLLDVPRNESLTVDHDARRKCPKCDDVVMMRHFAGVARQVELDECPGCAGFWLDAGELAKIRTQFATEQQRDKATEAYFAKTIGPELKRMQAENQQQLEKARKIANMFRFICPSYYIPGKQDWGAF